MSPHRLQGSIAELEFEPLQKFDPSEARDEEGRWTTGASTARVELMSLREAQQKAVDKWRSAPVPTAEQAARAAYLYSTIGASRAESNSRGSSDDRARRERNLLKEFGDGTHAPCVYCGVKMDGEHLTQDRLWPGSGGGRYIGANLVPACRNCNNTRSDTPFTETIREWGIAAAARPNDVISSPSYRGLEVLGSGTGSLRAPRWISGVLETWPVPGLGYTQTVIDGIPVDPRTIEDAATKYSPDQPRDEDGRFASGVGTEAELHQSPVQAAAHSWSNWSFMIREALSRPRVQRPGDTSLREGKLLVKAVNESRPTAYPLYRGLAMTEGDRERLIAVAKPGATLDLNLSSWTKGHDVALDFALNTYGTGRDDGYPAILTLLPGAHAYDATNDIAQGPQYTEHLSAGKFEVVSAAYAAQTPEEIELHVPQYQGPYEVTLRQVGTLNPDQLVGTKVAQ